MSSNEIVTSLARRVVANWHDLMSEDFRGVSASTVQEQLQAEANELGIWEDVYALASRIASGTN